MHFVFLGTSGAIPSPTRDTTSLVFVLDAGTVLVDVGGSPAARLQRAGIDPRALSHVVVTHLHADHAYGLPALVQSLRLLGRRAPLPVVCRPEHAGALEQLLALFGLRGRAGMFRLSIEAIGLGVGDCAFTVGDARVLTAPNAHGAMPNFAVRVEAAGRAVVYSSDTGPSDDVVALARDADTLVHEATFPHRDRGRFGVHSTAREAGEAAARSRVRRLLLTHVEADYHGELQTLAAEARAVFGGDVEVAQELVPYSF